MKRIALALTALLILLSASCGQRGEPERPPGHAPASEESLEPAAPPEETEPPEETGPAGETGFSFEGTVFQYGERSYDLSRRAPSINSILSAVPAGKKLVLECHAGPQNGVYCVFDTESETFDEDIAGNHLIWHSGDITTAVYSFWSGVYAYGGGLIKEYDLPEGAFIYDLAFSKDFTKLHVTAVEPDGTSWTDRVDR